MTPWQRIDVLKAALAILNGLPGSNATVTNLLTLAGWIMQEEDR